jgi:hypothetical protein
MKDVRIGVLEPVGALAGITTALSSPTAEDLRRISVFVSILLTDGEHRRRTVARFFRAD